MRRLGPSRVAAGAKDLDRRPTQPLLGECGLELGARQVRSHSKGMGAQYRRTGSILRHKQVSAKAERAGRVLRNLKARAAARQVKHYYLDECGFAPTSPTGCSWTPLGVRKLVEYEAPQGRRVNAPAVYRPYDCYPRLNVFTEGRTRPSP